MDEFQKKTDDTTGDHESEAPDTRDNLEATYDDAASSDEFEVDNAQDEPVETTEAADRDLTLDYSDELPETDGMVEDAHADAEMHEAREAADDIHANVTDKAESFDSATAKTADAMADDVQARADDLGDRAREAGIDIEHHAEDARADAGHNLDDANREPRQATDRNQSEGKSMVDEVQDKAKGFFNKIKDVFDGDKKS